MKVPGEHPLSPDQRPSPAPPGIPNRGSPQEPKALPYPHCEKGGQSKYHRIKSREASVSLLWKERVRGSFIPEGVYRILPVFQEPG